MKPIKDYLSLFAASLVITIFLGCSNEESLFYNTENKGSSIANLDLPLIQRENIDYEIIPVNGNNYVYLPKMTSTKTITRSTETARSYSASVVCTEIGLIVTITWDSTNATFRLSDGYTYAYQSFRYSINGSSINIDELWLRIYGSSGAHICDVRYSGTLNG